MPGPAKFLVRKTAAQWLASNPILGLGTFGIEVTTNQLKIGDGLTDWAGLHYAASPYDMLVGPTAITEQHIAEVWTNNNPVLTDQTIGYESDTHRGKIGDGVTAWRDLAYINGKEAVGVLLLESGAALLLEDGTLLLLSGAFTTNLPIYDVSSLVTVQGSFGAGLRSVVTSLVTATGSLGSGLLLRSQVAVGGSLGAGPLLTARVGITGQVAAGQSGVGPYMMADAVADAIGVNVHLEYGGSIYDTAWGTIIKPKLIELGTRHIRGGSGSGTARTTAVTRYKDLATNHSIKLLLVNISYVAETAYVVAGLSYIEAMEGRNEPDVFDNSPVDNWKAGLSGNTATFWNAVRAIPGLNTIKVLPPPLGHANNFNWLHTNFPGFGAYCDVGSLHDYGNETQKTIPEATANGGGGGWVGFGSFWSNNEVETKYRADLGSVKDIYSTEIGPRYDGPNASTEHQAAKAVARHLLTRVLGFGRKRLYFYQLIEQSSGEDFGLVRADGTNRPAFNALRNIVDLFDDRGPAFKTAALGYSLTGTTADMRWYVTQRRNGQWLLTIWRGVADSAGLFLTAEGTRATVTLNLTTLISRARRYEPTLAADMATAFKQRYLNPTSISVSVPDHPVVVELSPVYPTRSGLAWPSGMDLISDGDVTQANALATFRGRPLDCSMTFIDSRGYWGTGHTWTDVTSNNVVVRAGGQIDTLIRAGIRCVHAMPMCLEAERGDNAKRIYLDMQTPGSVYKGYYTLMCDRIGAWATTRAQQEMISIRIGWEANHGYPWSIADMSAIDLPYYTLWWNAVAAVVRARLPWVEIVWNHLQDSGATNIGLYQPDLALFDTVGADCYDGNFHSYWVDSDANWNLFKGSYNSTTGAVNGPQGFVDYARAIGKQVSFDEWGAFNRTTTIPPTPDGSNNLVFVTKMFEFFSANADILSFENYFNGRDEHKIEPTVCQPLPRQAYQASWDPNFGAGFNGATSIAIQGSISAGLRTALPAGIAAWGGMNHITGTAPSADNLTASISAGNALGLPIVRMGMDGVGGSTTTSPFTFTARDNAVNQYIAAGYEIHTVVSFRSFIANRNQANWRNFIRTCMNRYRGKIKVWIIDNEPDINNATALESANFTQWAREERDALGLQGVCLIAAPPCSSIERSYYTDMIDAGILNNCDLVSTHCYGSQFMDDRIRKLTDRILAGPGPARPVQISESYTPGPFAFTSGRMNDLKQPAVVGQFYFHNINSYPGGGLLWRERFLRMAFVQCKAFAMEHMIGFDMSGTGNNYDGDWRTVKFTGPSWVKNYPTNFDAIKQSFGTVHKFSNGGFEVAEDNYTNWFVIYNLDSQSAVAPEPGRVTYATTGQRTGGRCLRVNSPANTTIVRQVADGLVTGRSYQAEVWVFLEDAGTATLKAIGYNRLNGVAEVAASTTTVGAWTKLTVTVPALTHSWFVMELRTVNCVTRWDDAAIT